jgi:hypothetical protein
MLRSPEQILFFDAFFIILLGLYGITATGPQLSAMQSLSPPTLSPLPTGDASQCAWWDWVCIGINQNALARATAYIGWAFVNLPIILIWMFATTIIFLSIVLTVVFSPTFQSNGVPIIGMLFLFLQMFVGLEIIRIIRGVAQGL